MGNVGCWVGVAPRAQMGTSLPRVRPSASIHLPDSVSGVGPSSHFTDSEAQGWVQRVFRPGCVGSVSIQPFLGGMLCPTKQQNPFFNEDSLDLKAWENIPGVTARESPLCSLLYPRFQGAEGLQRRQAGS